MFIKEISSQKPLTPDQARINALKNASEQAKQRLKAERQRQKVRKAQADLARARQPAVPSVAAEGCATGGQFQTVPRGSEAWAVLFDTKDVGV